VHNGKIKNNKWEANSTIIFNGNTIPWSNLWTRIVNKLEPNQADIIINNESSLASYMKSCQNDESSEEEN
jgi:hypothetical protein